MTQEIHLVDDDRHGYVFGTWDAPVTDSDERIEPPIGATCIYCQDAIEAGDNGRISAIGFVCHRECSLRSVMGGIGHLVDHDHYCHDIGPDAGLSYRASAMLAWNWFQETHMHPTPEYQERWRAQLRLLLGQNPDAR